MPYRRTLKKLANAMQNATQNDDFDIFRIQLKEQNYKIYITKKKCNKRCRIHCTGNQITWERLVPMGTFPITTVDFTYRASELMEPDTFCLLVISGKPDMISGLDEGIFSCLGKLDTDSPKNRLYVMSEYAFEMYFIPTLKDID